MIIICVDVLYIGIVRFYVFFSTKMGGRTPVSYTHLDVYKRQRKERQPAAAAAVLYAKSNTPQIAAVRD